MKRFSVVFLALLLLFGCAHQGLEQTGAWSPTTPAAGIQARYIDDAIRTNNAAIDAVFGTMLTAGTAVTSTAAELNLLDGATLSTAELNILDGATLSTAELNLLDGATLSTAELNILDGATLSTAELNILDGATLSTAELNILDGVTSTAAELSTLHSSGITNADLVKVHAITKTAAQVNSHMPAVASMHATNAAEVTFGVAGGVVCSISVGNVSVGDIILVTGNMYAENIGTAGSIRLQINNTGTATVQEATHEIVVSEQQSVGAFGRTYLNASQLYVITGAGTFGLQLIGSSDNGSACGANYSGLHAVFLVKG